MRGLNQPHEDAHPVPWLPLSFVYCSANVLTTNLGCCTFTIFSPCDLQCWNWCQYLLQWQTTWDRSKLFTSLAPSSPINFMTPGPIGSADIVINDGTKFQSIAGFGATLSISRSRPPSTSIHLIFSSIQLADTSALTLNNLKVCVIYRLAYQSSWRVTKARNSGNYQNLLNYMFSPIDGANAAGLNYIRIPIGASDFSANRMFFLHYPLFGIILDRVT